MYNAHQIRSARQDKLVVDEYTSQEVVDVIASMTYEIAQHTADEYRFMFKDGRPPEFFEALTAGLVKLDFRPRYEGKIDVSDMDDVYGRREVRVRHVVLVRL
jgi:hypothetical protein